MIERILVRFARWRFKRPEWGKEIYGQRQPFSLIPPRQFPGLPSVPAGRSDCQDWTSKPYHVYQP